MKAQRTIILEALCSGSLTKDNLMAITHYKPYKMQMILDAMVNKEMITYDEDEETYQLLADYTPPSNWSFRELLGVWK